MEKYFNFTYLAHHLNFGDIITLTTGKTYSVEQVHDGYLLDCYDKQYELHTFDLKRLFLFEKIEKINDFVLPKLDKENLINGNNIKKPKDNLWLLISFDELLIALKNERILSSIYSTKSEVTFDKADWEKSHFIKLQNKIKEGDYVNMINRFGDRLAYVAIKPDVLDEAKINVDKKFINIYQKIEFNDIDKIYFSSQNSLDKFLGEARLITHDTSLTSKCIFDPYPLDEDLAGKW